MTVGRRGIRHFAQGDSVSASRTPGLLRSKSASIKGDGHADHAILAARFGAECGAADVVAGGERAVGLDQGSGSSGIDGGAWRVRAGRKARQNGPGRASNDELAHSVPPGGRALARATQGFSDRLGERETRVGPSFIAQNVPTVRLIRSHRIAPIDRTSSQGLSTRARWHGLPSLSGVCL